MKAVRIHRFGGPEVLQIDEVPTPEPGPGEILVRVGAASVNPVDYKMRKGEYPRPTERDLPAGLGRDLSGVIEAIGPNVSGVVPGEPIFAFIDWARSAYADHVIVKPGEFAAKPETLTLIDAASLPLAAITAWQGLFDHGGLKAGERVLIHGGSGGVGYLAVQFAKLNGAEVLATAGTEAVSFVKSLGADRVVDYKSERFEEAVADVDLVFDLIGGETRDRSWGVLKPDGRLVSTLASGDPAAQGREHGRRGSAYMAHPDAEQLGRIARYCDEAELKIFVAAVFPLKEVQSAHAYLERGHPRGKVVLEI
jgi:NADPH:quinone reductase-like Zn-dependent oxidoreductase